MCYSEYLAELMDGLSSYDREAELCALSIAGSGAVLPEFPEAYAVISADGVSTTSIELVLSPQAKPDAHFKAA